jgi:hypothetical protein
MKVASHGDDATMAVVSFSQYVFCEIRGTFHVSTTLCTCVLNTVSLCRQLANAPGIDTRATNRVQHRITHPTTLPLEADLKRQESSVDMLDRLETQRCPARCSQAGNRYSALIRQLDATEHHRHTAPQPLLQ